MSLFQWEKYCLKLPALHFDLTNLYECIVHVKPHTQSNRLLFSSVNQLFTQ